ncbi:alkylhydroperoxidase [Solemya pervernicosa gill symbiont]|uniref:Alkylhydroperoxidase n=2 Tax=Gammaproteobacteria incertae sedis TaxID=118884 RepID=A0A1T2L2I4_9GAMM|nr:carboxymuconolactone decarboxylase family protein [Candidatus Reidiella endopervernicosa]OOZ39299.1 alkylhydroperoxidase [Solemya pervernicosa gill symbiont]QKQ25519.1 carboxymuconolactone decarboxylase family protein [Candidatus Reidiella endopervernicosa]
MSDLAAAMTKARQYGIGEYLELLGELSQESQRKGKLERKTKELITLGIALAKGCNRCITIHTQAAKQLGAKNKELREVNKVLLFLNASPADKNEDLWREWKDSWAVFSASKGAINRKHRELIGLGIGIVRQQKRHIELHTKAAYKIGVTPEAIFEVMPIALLMDGAPALSQIPHLVNQIDKLTS